MAESPLRSSSDVGEGREHYYASVLECDVMLWPGLKRAATRCINGTTLHAKHNAHIHSMNCG